MPTAIPQRLLTPSQAGEYLGIKPQTLAVWRSCGRHDLPFVKVGGRVKYRRSDLDDWLAARTHTHTGQAAE